ncbi:MAG: response regulator [Hyphomicrobiaceae bacterium]|nr:MAG: response regulator [Hyphomicrobiaceae bacterium]
MPQPKLTDDNVRRHTCINPILFGHPILIVEDEPLVALHLHAVLSGAGAGVLAATNAKEALQLISRNDLSAAIVDIMLGDLDCGAICQALFHHRVPFLFHTGHMRAAIVKAWPEVPVLIKPAAPPRNCCARGGARELIRVKSITFVAGQQRRL